MSRSNPIVPRSDSTSCKRNPFRKATVSHSRQRLLEWMQDLNFGEFQGLVVKNGDPVLDPPPRIVVEHRFGAAENGPRPERQVDDFSLKMQVIELLRYFDQLANGTIDILQVKHGLPVRMFVSGNAE